MEHAYIKKLLKSCVSILSLCLLTNIQGLNFLQQAHERHVGNKTKVDYRHSKNHHFHHGIGDPIHVISGDPLEGLTWRDMRTVNGLKNNNVAFMLISSFVDNGRLYRQRIIPAARTWMRLAANVFVIIEDTIDARMAFRNCPHLDRNNMTSFHCHNEPVVVLSKVCSSNPSTSDGICCKVDELVNYLVNVQTELFNQHIKFALVCDDDSYWRVDRVLQWLSWVDKANLSHLPLVGNSFPYFDYAYDVNETMEAFDLKCREMFTGGWYGHLLMNKVFLERYKTVPFGLSKTCQIWKTAQDVNFGKFAWALEAFHISIPGDIEVSPQFKRHEHLAFLNKYLGFHHVYYVPDDKLKHQACDVEGWPQELRYNQESLMGCGSLQHLPMPFMDHHKGLGIYEMWLYFAVNGTDDIELRDEKWKYLDGKKSDPVPVVTQLIGYNRSKHATKSHYAYGPLKGSDWLPYGPKDCENFDSSKNP